MCSMECRRFSQTMASEWQTAFVVSHKMPWCALLTAVKNYNKSLEKLQDFFFKTETKTKTKCSRPRPRPRLHDPRPTSRPRLSFLSSRRLETEILVSRTTSLGWILADSKSPAFYVLNPTVPILSIKQSMYWAMMRVWRLSVAYIGPKSKTERPRKTKIGTEAAHITRDSEPFSRSKSQRSTCRGRRHIVAASRTACFRNGKLVSTGIRQRTAVNWGTERLLPALISDLARNSDFPITIDTNIRLQ